MKIKKTHYILTLFLLWSGTLWAQTRFTATVSQSTVGTGEPFEVTFSVNANIERFNPPDLSAFQVLGGPNQSSSMTSINGNMSTSMSLSYDLLAAKEGEYTIGPATITVNGKTYRSAPIKVRIIKGHATPQNNRASSSGAGSTAVPEGKTQNLAKSLFMRAIPDKTSVYQGEQVSVSYKLYTSVELVDNQLDKLPDFNGFWSQEIKNNNPNVQWSTEVYNGTTYHVAVLKQIILFPEHSGNLTLDPLGMTFLVRQVVPSNDPFDQIFGGGSYKDVKYKVKSTPVTIHVKSLPEAGKPAGYQGAVGNFALSAVVDRTALKANEALNYVLKISGSGNLKLLNTPVASFPPDFEKYDPKVTDHITESTGGVSGSREYTFLLIPRREGNYTLPPYTFTYFNPTTAQYVTLTSGAFAINVAKGAPGSEVKVYASGKQKEDRMLDKDMLDIQSTQNHFSRAVKAIFGSFWLYLAVVLALLSWFGFKYYKKWDAERNSDVVQVKRRNANKIAARHMAHAGKQLSGGDKKAFYEAVYKGIYGYLSDKLNIPVADLNHENIISRLREAALDESIIQNLAETLEMCEMARYAPVSGVKEAEVFEKAKNNISDIEAHLRV